MLGAEERDTIYMGFPGERPPYYAYEAVQIFNDCSAFPVLVPERPLPENSAKSGIWLQKNGERKEIPYFAAASEKMEHKLQKREIYKIMNHFTGYWSPWGCMTGVDLRKL